MVGKHVFTTPVETSFMPRSHNALVFGEFFSMATAASSIEGRRAARDLVSFRAPFDGPAGIRASVLMVDISPFGFMSRCQAPVAPGDVVAVKLPVVGNRAARIVWSLGGRVGGEFLEPIASDIYAMMLRRAPTDKPAWNEF
jgi:hypothetical protein